MSLSAKIAEYITFARNLEPGESVIYSYILVPPNLIENQVEEDHNPPPPSNLIDVDYERSQC